QRRAFIHVGDVVEVNLWFLQQRGLSGIFNCGTGRAQTFNQLAAAVINSVQGTQLPVPELVGKGLIEYVPFPAGKGTYSMSPLPTSSGTGSCVPCTELITAAASWLKVCARPVPQLKMPDSPRCWRNQRFTSTTSPTWMKARRCSPLP